MKALFRGLLSDRKNFSSNDRVKPNTNLDLVAELSGKSFSVIFRT